MRRRPIKPETRDRDVLIFAYRLAGLVPFEIAPITGLKVSTVRAILRQFGREMRWNWSSDHPWVGRFMTSRTMCEQHRVPPWLGIPEGENVIWGPSLRDRRSRKFDPVNDPLGFENVRRRMKVARNMAGKWKPAPKPAMVSRSS